MSTSIKMKEIFKKLIINFQEGQFSRIVPRDYDVPLDTKKIVSLIGVRRSGKTYILFSLIEKLRKTIDPKNIIYINFEDDRLYPLELKNYFLFHFPMTTLNFIKI